MKNLNVFRLSFIAAFCLTSAVGCGPKRAQQSPGSIPEQNAPAGAGASPGKGGPEESQGTSVGGGGFVGENSTVILKQSAKGLAQFIRFASPEVFKNLPKDWTQEKLATVIENVRYEPMTERSREGDLLMFDYGVDAKGPYIVALRPFFVAYSSFPIQFASRESKATLFEDVRLKLAHEVSHLFGAKEPQAKIFSKNLMRALYNDNLICDGDGAEGWLEIESNAFGKFSSHVHTMINRPSGITWALGYSKYPGSEKIKVYFDTSGNPIKSRSEFEEKLKDFQSTFVQLLDPPRVGNYELKTLTEFHNQEATGNLVSGAYSGYGMSWSPQDIKDGQAEYLSGGYRKASHPTEILTVIGLSADIRYLEKGTQKPGRLSMNCKWNGKPVEVEKEMTWDRQDFSPTPPKVDTRKVDFLNELASKPEFTDHFTKSLGGLKIKVIGIEPRGAINGVSTSFCGGKGNQWIPNEHQMAGSLILNIGEDRTCSIGFEGWFNYSNQKDLQIKRLQLAQGFAFPSTDPRSQTINDEIVCYRGTSLKGQAEDLRKLIPKVIFVDETVETMCSWPESKIYKFE
ncbi:MAG: hypothetical protein AB7F86_15230 [Bdellovibrionales bacterium]